MSMPENTIHTGETGDSTAAGGTATPPEEKTFTQEQLNIIIGERLAKEKSKNEALLAAREQELAQREFMFTAQKTLSDRGFPPELLDALNTSSPEAFKKSLSIIAEIFGDPSTPKPTFQVTGPTPGLPSAHYNNSAIRSAMGLYRRE